ncbi:DNA topoisomerase 2-binding protein 1 [Podila clonocystis]|nr:DNA topoisomerase 2-binding protein 1 [Podila clonocystis]
MFRQSNTKKSTAPPPPRPSRNAPPQDQSQSLNSSQPLKSFKISFTGLKIDERNVASTMIQDLGGESNVTLTEDVTHLIARSEGSQKYRVALKLRIPVLALEWINELHDQWKNKGVLDMKAVNLKKEIEDFTLQFGGTYNMDMIKGTTTHLICEKPTGKKFTTAKDWGIKCVPFQWLEDMKEKQDKRRSSRKLSSPDSLEEEDTSDLQSGSNSDQFLESCCIYLCKSFRPEMATRLKKMVLTGGGVFVQEYQPSSVTHVVVPSNSLDPQTLALFENMADMPYVVDVQWLGGSSKAKKALPESDYIVPFPARTEDGIGPVRTDESLLWTTDAVLNPDRQKVSKMATIRSKLKPLKSVPPDTYSESNPSSVTSSPAGTMVLLTPVSSSLSAPRLLRSRTDSGVLAEALGVLSMTGTGGELLSTQTGRNNCKIDLSVLEEELEEEGQQAPISNIFLGLNITAFGCKKKKTERIKQGTVAYGGTYFDAGTIPSGEENTMLTVIPLTSSQSSVQHLKGVVLTDLWFERSVEEDRAITNYKYFMFKPLKTIPIPGFSNLKISMSTGSVTEIEYRQTARLIKVLGGEFHDNLNTITTNLLISDNAAGAKFNFMRQNNRPIVKMDWLKNCVEKGERLPFEAYFPDIRDTPVKDELVIKTEMPSQYGGQSQYLAHTQTLEFQNADKTQVPSDTPLDGCTVCVPTRIQGNHKELCDLVQELGGRLLTAYNSSRRRAAPVEESPTTDSTVTSNGSTTETESFDTTSLPDVLFDKAEKYDEDTVYWDDVDGREKKRAFLESLGYKVQSRDPKSDTKEPPQLCFLITGVQERLRYYEMIKDLGGICLELETMDEEVWRQKCTHLITNGKNPPRTAKLVAAQTCGAYIVTKTFVTDSAARGAFVDEGPYHVN